MLPGQFVALSFEEKAVIMAFIDERIKEEKEQQKKMKAKKPRKR